MRKRAQYIGTYHIGTGVGNPQEVWSVGNKLVVRSAYGRRKNRLDRALEFVKACRRWWRVQRLGSRA